MTIVRTQLVAQFPPWMEDVNRVIRAALDAGWVPVDPDKLLEDLGTLVANQAKFEER